jgi:protein TonB
MSATVNAFPPLHQLTFRHWTLLLIVGLHVAFFWALNAGMTPSFAVSWIPSTTLVATLREDRQQTKPEPVERRDPVGITHEPLPTIPMPEPVINLQDPIPDGAPLVPFVDSPPVGVSETRPEPVVVEPQADPRVGLSAPTYPASEIRAGHEGTVLLSVYVLENGRVGQVRIERSSGYERLDQAAVREARRWRFKPGMRDGVPVPMWKQVPITYQLREERNPILRF